MRQGIFCNNGNTYVRTILLFHCIINRLLDAWADIELSQFGIPGIGMHSIAQEDINYLIGRIHPNTGTSEASMTIDGGRGIVGTGTLGLVYNIWLVEAKTTATDA